MVVKNLILYLSDDNLIWKDKWDKFDGVTTIVKHFKEGVPKGFVPCLNQVDKDDKVKCSRCKLCAGHIKTMRKICFEKH